MNVKSWDARKTDCKKCSGFGYKTSDDRHESGQATPAWAVLCDCQPKTMTEIEEAAEQVNAKLD